MKHFWMVLSVTFIAGVLGIYGGAMLNLEGYLGAVCAIAVAGAFIVDAIEKKKMKISNNPYFSKITITTSYM